MPEVFGPGRRVFGVWFWELDSLPPGQAGTEVDEIWAASTFMADAFAQLGSAEVVTMPLPFAPPEPSSVGRSGLGPLAAAGDRFVFGVVLDHLSITARKNPIGAIRAFRQAFAPDEGPLLVVKTINGRRCWREHERVRAAASGRPDIVVWDEQLPRADHAAFIAHCDALVSLHRSEGLGLHLAEAMAMGVPVIATRYSGNLDFMDDDSAMLIDATIVPVGSDGGWAYPATARWAEPDLDQAASAMRHLVTDPDAARRLGDAGRARMASMPSEDDFVARVRARAGLDSPSGTPR
jgi:glycosyltransferase involved in cell wall biosynthesis